MLSKLKIALDNLQTDALKSCIRRDAFASIDYNNAVSVLADIIKEAENPGQMEFTTEQHPETLPLSDLLTRCVCTVEHRCIKCISEAGA